MILVDVNLLWKRSVPRKSCHFSPPTCCRNLNTVASISSAVITLEERRHENPWKTYFTHVCGLELWETVVLSRTLGFQSATKGNEKMRRNNCSCRQSHLVKHASSERSI